MTKILFGRIVDLCFVNESAMRKKNSEARRVKSEPIPLTGSYAYTARPKKELLKYNHSRNEMSQPVQYLPTNTSMPPRTLPRPYHPLHGRSLGSPNLCALF
jgi:hypothetical protein